MTTTEARQAALIEAAACIIEKACENRGCDELTIAEATTALENVYEVLALARALKEAEARAQQAEAEAQRQAATIETALEHIEDTEPWLDEKPLTAAELQQIVDEVYGILQKA